MTRRFKYALEPVRLQRDWSLLASRLQLAERNDALARQEREVVKLHQQAEAVRQEWRACAEPARTLRLETMAAYAAYLAQLERTLGEARDALTALEREREHAAAQVAQAARELDAVERHKADQRAAFGAGLNQAQMRDADDHWSILRTRSAHVSEA
jgi:predicted  nucleic acid-binding Zn-ribbon protein